MISRRSVVAAFATSFLVPVLGAVLDLTGSSHAQTYPSKPIKVVLPYTPGSPNDVLARLVAPPLAARLGQPVVIDNRPGGGTTIGAKAVMAAEPDGHTLLFTNTPTHAIAPLISKSAAFDPIHDFVPVATVGSTILVLVIGPTVPANTVAEFVSYAKANPGKLNFGFGRGTLPHLVGEMFKAETGADITSIPYKGGAQAVTDILGGQIHMNLGATVTLVPLIRAGQIKALAVTGPARHPDLPEVPTMIESGLPNVTTVTHYGFMGPAGMPDDIVKRLNGEVNEVLKSPELTASMAKLGFAPQGGSPQDFAALLAEQVRKWSPVVKTIGFTME
jgi:tripartite-type tricarboxylate transporter receptor subunit TctC